MSGERPPRAAIDDADAAARAAHARQFLPALMLVVNTSPNPDLEVVRAAVQGGATMVQVRNRGDAPDDGSVAAEVSRIVGERALLLINDDISGEVVALMGLGAAMHLPEPAPGAYWPPLAALRELLGEWVMFSCAVHGVEAALEAEARGADMLVLGTVFASKSHPGAATIGLEGVRAVCAAVSLPVIGIGGITAENAGDVMSAGAAGVAVISAIFDAADPASAAAVLRAVIGAGVEAG